MTVPAKRFLLLLAWITLSAASKRYRHEMSTISTTEAKIVFPGSRPHVKLPERPRPNPVNDANETNTSQIPVSLFLRSSVRSADDFINNFINNKGDVESAIPSFSILPRNTSVLLRANTGARTGEVVQMAHCEPNLTPVELEKSNDPAVIFFPSCTRVERCGGCCLHDLLTCEPTASEMLHVKVMMARYEPGTDGFQHEGFKNVEIEKHLSCECKCRIKEEDCNAHQDYHPNECKCICRNEHEIRECNGENKFWDPRSCECHCRNVRECSTGFYYDSESCSCLPEMRAPAFRIPTGINFRWKSPSQAYDVAWEADDRRRFRRPAA